MHWLQQRKIMADTARALVIDSRADAQILVEEDALPQQSIEGCESERIGLIKLLIVSGDTRGMGVGGTLLREGIAWLEGHGCQKVCLLSDKERDWQFYEHLGMERTAEGAATVKTLAGESYSMGAFVYEAWLQDLKARLFES